MIGSAHPRAALVHAARARIGKKHAGLALGLLLQEKQSREGRVVRHRRLDALAEDLELISAEQARDASKVLGADGNVEVATASTHPAAWRLHRLGVGGRVARHRPEDGTFT